MVESKPPADGVIPLGLPIDAPPLYKRHSSVDGGGTRHTFKVIQPMAKKRAQMVDTEATRAKAALEQKENEHEVLRRKVFAKSNRSSRKSSRSLGRAETEIQATEEFKTDSRNIQQQFTNAQAAITDAAEEALLNLPEELTREYMERNRNKRGGSARFRGWQPRV